MPVVSVVVIGYNDAANLETAVRSALGQSLHDIEVVVVDDASTDGTPRVTARLAAQDARVRPVRLPENSGGCSRPRNVGVEHARGRYVTFLDSDDVLHRRACERLVGAALRTDADMVCGRYVRRHHHPRRYLAAHDELYLASATLESILDRPEQLRDTPCCSKLYRRAMLLDNDLRFPEGLLFEDLLFTTQAYCTARRIAIVPDLVYVWNVRRAAADPSITNRLEIRNWADRFEIHRRIDRYLAGRQAADALRVAKDRKFLDVDFQWFLRQLRMFPTKQRPELLELAAGYVAGIDLAGQSLATPAARVGAYLAAHRDLDATLRAADWAATGQVGNDLVARDGRLWWDAAGVDAADPPAALDVTATGWLRAGFSGTPFLAAVREASADADRLTLHGVVADVLGRLGPAGELDATVEVSGRVGGALWRTAAALTPRPAAVGFTATVDLAQVGRRLLRPTVGHELRLQLVLRRAGETARLPVSARDATLPAGELPLPTPWAAVVGDRARLAEVNGRLVLTLTGLPGWVDASLEAASRARYAGRRLWLRRRLVG